MLELVSFKFLEPGTELLFNMISHTIHVRKRNVEAINMGTPMGSIWVNKEWKILEKTTKNKH